MSNWGQTIQRIRRMTGKRRPLKKRSRPQGRKAPVTVYGAIETSFMQRMHQMGIEVHHMPAVQGMERLQ